jgi:hypothetical protein
MFRKIGILQKASETWSGNVIVNHHVMSQSHVRTYFRQHIQPANLQKELI